MTDHQFNFSFILNSRGRPGLLKNLFQSIKNTAANLDRIELLCAIDSDDQETIGLSKESPIFDNIRWFIQPRPESLNTSLTFLGLRAGGTYIFNINDDVEILTPGWDTIILNRIHEYKEQNKIKDNIIYVGVEDNSVDKTPGRIYASFPIISKEAVNLIGIFMYPAFKGLGGDSSIARVYQSIDRILLVPEVKLDHIYHNNIISIMSPDETAASMRAVSWKNPVDPFTFDVSNEVNKLKEYIHNYGNPLSIRN